ncbi:MAG: hypothetical protein Q8O19_00315, partial [Rectinemataceae bacterium]|nr:hypothetical protein [Rectinemataceae bacterium]
AAQGDRRRPEISGLRFLAHFGEHLEMNIGEVSRWGGVRKDGSRVMDGTTGGEYLLAFLGAENLVVAEGSGNAEDPDPNNRYKVGSGFKNLSNSVVNVEFRLRLPALARTFGAQGFALYLSRGGNNVNWQWKDFFRRPGSAISHDFRFYHNAFTKPDAKLLHSDPGSVWGWGYSQAVPSLTHVNDTFGAQWVFPTWDLAVEVSDTRNQTYPGSTYRTYSNGTYISGHSYYGDSLGQAFGGEVYRQSLDVEWRPDPTWRIRLLLADAIRVPRDIPDSSNPPQADDYFTFIQFDMQKRFGAHRLGGSLALEDHSAWQYVKGQRHRNAILSLGWSRTF